MPKVSFHGEPWRSLDASGRFGCGASGRWDPQMRRLTRRRTSERGQGELSRGAVEGEEPAMAHSPSRIGPGYRFHRAKICITSSLRGGNPGKSRCRVLSARGRGRFDPPWGAGNGRRHRQGPGADVRLPEQAHLCNADRPGFPEGIRFPGWMSVVANPVQTRLPEKSHLSTPTQDFPTAIQGLEPPSACGFRASRRPDSLKKLTSNLFQARRCA